MRLNTKIGGYLDAQQLSIRIEKEMDPRVKYLIFVKSNTSHCISEMAAIFLILKCFWQTKAQSY